MKILGKVLTVWGSSATVLLIHNLYQHFTLEKTSEKDILVINDEKYEYAQNCTKYKDEIKKICEKSLLFIPSES